MFQFTTNTVINSATDENGVARYAKIDLASGPALRILKTGTFKKDNIVSLHKRPYQAAVLEKAEITIKDITAGDVLRLEVGIHLSEQTEADYANSYMDFKKPIILEIISSGTAATDATKFAQELTKLGTRFGYSYFKAEVKGTTPNDVIVVLTAKTPYQRFKKVELSKAVATTDYNLVKYSVLSTGSVTLAGKVGFGDDDWMVRRVMLPTAENVRYFGITKEERPILGGNYSEFVLRYKIDKDGDDGIVSGHKSITTHVFWVPAALVSAFETEVVKVVPVGLSVTASKTTLDTSDNESATLTILNAVGPVTIVSGTPNTLAVSGNTVTTDGVSGTGEVTVTVTDTLGNVATVTITVVP